VLAQAEIVARDPLVVRSPMDGIISSLHVQPNTVVEEGTLLLKLDDTELQTRQDVAEQTLAISRAQYQQAGQAAAFDVNAKASLRVLALESEKRQSEVEYVNSLLERSNVEADQGGVIIMPNSDELIGKPVVTGERLMTIADPLDTQLEAWLSVGDDITLLYDTRIEFFPNVAPDKKFKGRLRRMDYRAEPTASGELAYRIRGDFEDGQILPRIGMRGTAKLYGERVSLGYYLLRRPLATIRRWLGV
jgi:multidrug efflux pump subunit AcrA (membrane-fusion protein)